MRHVAWGLVGVVVLGGLARGAAPKTGATVFHVATDGNDAWTGRPVKPNAKGTDGPFRTLHRARDAIRQLRAPSGGKLTRPVDVVVGPGVHYLGTPLVLGPADSGTAACPIAYRAAKGQRVVLSGGRTIGGTWTPYQGRIVQVRVPEAAAGTWHFRQLRVGRRHEVRARHPNLGEDLPCTGPYCHVPEVGGFGSGMGCVQEPGTWLEYEVAIPADGSYTVRIRYANNGNTNTRCWKTRHMSGRTTLSVGGGEPVPLADLTDTKSFYAGFRWARAARLRLTRGPHVIRWTNVKGGGLSLDAFVLTDDATYEPRVVARNAVSPATKGTHVVLVQCEAYQRSHGKLICHQMFERQNPTYKTSFGYAPGDLAHWARSPDAELFIIPEYDWTSELVRLVSVDEKTHTAKIAGTNCMKVVMRTNRFYATGVLEKLDTPGEWCLVRKTGTLYYWPRRTDFAKQPIVAPCMDRVIDIAGDATANKPVEHIRIEGFTITDVGYISPETVTDIYYPNDGAIWLRTASHCRVVNNAFTDVGGHAVCVHGASTHNRIVANRVARAGQGGVYINGSRVTVEPRKPAPLGRQPSHNLVSGNHIHHCGTVYKHVAGVMVNYAHHNTVSHNLIHDVPRYGVSLKFNCFASVVEYNEIRRTNLETRDTCAIEMACNYKDSIVRYNLVVDSIGSGYDRRHGKHRRPQDAGGVYLDNLSSRATVVGNICVRCMSGLWMNQGGHNTIENNIFYDCRGPMAIFNHHRNHQTAKRYQGNRFERNIISYADPTRQLYAVGGWKGDRLGIASDHNVIYAGGREPKVGWYRSEQSMWDKWRAAGQDVHSVIADPMFVDAAKEDFRLKPGSPALRVGFKPIDTSRIGLAGYEPR